MKNLEEFYKEILGSKDLQKEFVSCKKEEDVVLFLKKNNCDAKVDDIKKFLREKFNKEEKVDNEALKSMSGGNCGSGSSDVKIYMSSNPLMCPTSDFDSLVKRYT